MRAEFPPTDQPYLPGPTPGYDLKKFVGDQYLNFWYLQLATILISINQRQFTAMFCTKKVLQVKAYFDDIIS